MFLLLITFTDPSRKSQLKIFNAVSFIKFMTVVSSNDLVYINVPPVPAYAMHIQRAWSYRSLVVRVPSHFILVANNEIHLLHLLTWKAASYASGVKISFEHVNISTPVLQTALQTSDILQQLMRTVVSTVSTPYNYSQQCLTLLYLGSIERVI